MDSLYITFADMIKSRSNSKSGRGQGQPRRGRGGSSRSGRMTGVRNRGGGSLRVNTTRPSASMISKAIRRTKGLPWQRDMFEESLRAVGLPVIDNGAKLFISNLDSRVSNEDIRELFSEIGELKRYAIHFDKNGRPSGSAEVVYSRRSDAFQAMKRYNNVQLDGKPMKIEIVGANSEVPILARGNVVGVADRRRTVMVKQAMGRGRGSIAFNRNSGLRSRDGIPNDRRGVTNGRGRLGRGNGLRGGRVHGRGGGRGGNRNVDKSADELDKELENYHAEAMQT